VNWLKPFENLSRNFTSYRLRSNWCEIAIFVLQ
jgi:hypothetical protein